MTNEQKTKWNYPVLEASENKIGSKSITPPNNAFELAGADCSIKGGIRPFPGFKKIHSFSTLAAETDMDAGSEILDVFPISFRISTDKYGYGFIYRVKEKATATPEESSIFMDVYWDGNEIDGDKWRRGINVSTGIPTSSPMDVQVFGKYVYILIKNVEPILFYIKYEALVVASCTLTVSGSGQAVGLGSTVSLIPTDGDTTIVATAHDTTTSTSIDNYTPTFEVVDGDRDATAINLKNCLNPHSKLVAAVTDNVVTVTQATAGSAGNTVVTLTETAPGSMTKSNFSGGSGIGTSVYSVVTETDTGPGIQIKNINYRDDAGVLVGTLPPPSGTGEVSQSQFFLTNDSDIFGSNGLWDTRPSEMEGLPLLEKGNYAVATVLNDPDTGRKTSLSELVQLKDGDFVENYTSTLAVANHLFSVFTGKTLTLQDENNTVVFTFLTGGTTQKNSSTDYTIGLNTGATATITNTEATVENETIEIISTDLTSRTYVSKADATGSDLHFDHDGTPTQRMASLKAAIESSGGHAGKITVIQNAGVLTLIQTVTGVAGDTEITEGLSNTTKTNFTGGATNSESIIYINSQIKAAIDLSYTNTDLLLITTGLPASHGGNPSIKITHKFSNSSTRLSASTTVGESDFSVSTPARTSFDTARMGVEIVYDSSKFSQAYIYRSIKVQDAGGSFSAAVVQLDNIINLADYLVNDQTGMTPDFKRALYFFTLEDLALIYQDPYVDRSIFDENMPKAGAGVEFDGIFLVSDIEGSTQGADGELGDTDRFRGVGEFRWSSMANTSPELFPPENFYVPSKISNQVIAFERSGGTVLGFSKNSIMHISREFTGSISYIKILPVHEGYGVINKRCVQSMGPFTYYLNNKGLKSIDAQARLDSLHALDGLLEEWKDDFSSLSMSYDSKFSTLYILNSNKKETAVLWFGTSMVSELHDMPFSLTCTGQWPTDLSDNNSDLIERGMFLQNQPSASNPDASFSPCIWIADTKREDTTGTSCAASDFDNTKRITLLHYGGDTRFEISAVGGSTITLNSSTTGHQGVAPTLLADAWIGAYIYCIGSTTESNIGKKAQIQSTSGTVLTLQNQTWTPVVGDRVGISPVYIRWEGSIIGFNEVQNPQEPNINGLHRTRVIDSAGCYFSEVSGNASIDTVDTDDVFYKFLVFEGNSSTATSEGIPKDLSGTLVKSIFDGESTYWASPETHGVHGMVLSPGIEVFCPDLDFRLLSVIIEGKILSSSRTERPT